MGQPPLPEMACKWNATACLQYITSRKTGILVCSCVVSHLEYDSSSSIGVVCVQGVHPLAQGQQQAINEPGCNSCRPCQRQDAPLDPPASNGLGILSTRIGNSMISCNQRTRVRGAACNGCAHAQQSSPLG